MRTFLIATMVLAAGSAWAQTAPVKTGKPVLLKAVETARAATTITPPPDGASKRIQVQQDAMKAISFLDGEWRGTSKTLRKAGWVQMVQTERVGAMLEGTVKVIEVRSYEAGKLSFDALRIISYDPERKTYSMRSYQGGSVRDYDLRVTPTGIAWEIASRGDTKVRYETTVRNGVWSESATRTSAKGESETYLQVSVKRVRASTWPEGGALLAK